MNRIEWIDVAKGMSIILVVFYHAMMFAEAQGLPIPALYTEITAPLRYIRMPLFFTVSAILIGAAAGRAGFVAKWIVPTLWLLAVWNLIYALIGDADFHIEELLTPYGHLWFLCALIVFRVAWAVLDKVRLPALAAAGAWSFWMLWTRETEMALLLRNTLTYLFFFLGAAWYGRPIASRITRTPWLAFGLGAVATAVSWKLAFRFGVSVAGVGMLWAAAVLIAQVRLPCDLLRWLGRHSLEIFLIHYALLLPLTLLAAGLPGWAVPLLVAAGATLIPVALRRLTDKVAPWLFRLPQIEGRSVPA